MSTLQRHQHVLQHPVVAVARLDGERHPQHAEDGSKERKVRAVRNHGRIAGAGA